ncbi:MAG: tRNA (adenosine(37)-N6)-threonylcarbamoyltransferase complex dimerization subunit type 1 TsaB [Alphaproteobacteria bacterium]|nr:tRNA (adenosine(37)-N6)-threonylcarbamoyltransferase complex dimerization subunit type 1 TsaB [Alphaproteobacteria bacterium]MBV9553257.1 tRNA (adenosine(37)-N6)-threonylcarbamoyltransferase complex dimerization subunit type 1 TsaB [Alphaproteobacteria bacterium]
MPSYAAADAEPPAGIVLAFDTAGSACSAAVARDGRTVAHERRQMRHGHAEALLPMIERVTLAAGAAPTEIRVVAVTVGPGGFTGIRAGLAAAQGIALAAGARLVGITSFAAVAALVEGDDRPLLIALDGRREELFVQLFDAGDNPYGEPAAVPPRELGGFVGGRIGAVPLRLAGDAAAAAAAALAAHGGVVALSGVVPDAAGVLAALRAYPNRLAPAGPLYLRPADVSLPRSQAVGIVP